MGKAHTRTGEDRSGQTEGSDRLRDRERIERAPEPGARVDTVVRTSSFWRTDRSDKGPRRTDGIGDPEWLFNRGMGRAAPGRYVAQRDEEFPLDSRGISIRPQTNSESSG